MSTRMTLLALKSAVDEEWTDALATLLALHPILVGTGEDDYISVVLNPKLCHHEMCIGAHDKSVQFPNRFADDGEDVLDTFTIVEVVQE